MVDVPTIILAIAVGCFSAAIGAVVIALVQKKVDQDDWGCEQVPLRSGKPGLQWENFHKEREAVEAWSDMISDRDIGPDADNLFNDPHLDRKSGELDLYGFLKSNQDEESEED